MDWRRPIRRLAPEWMRRTEFVFKTERGVFEVAPPWSALRVLFSLIRRRPVRVPGTRVVLPFDDNVGYHVRESTEKIRRLAAYVEPGDVVFDVGAHAGLFSVMAAEAGARVVAVEPDPDVAGFLRSNTKGLDIDVVEAAVAEVHGGKAILWRNRTSTQASSLIRDAAEAFGDVEAVEVSAVTFSELVDRHGAPDVVKIDVQGLESRLLPSVPLEAVRVLLVEVSDLDENPHLRDDLSSELGEPDVVNSVRGGADLAFTRRQ